MIQRPKFSIPGLVIQSEPVKEEPRGNGVVERKYVFECKLDRVEKFGPFNGDIVFQGSDQPSVTDSESPFTARFVHPSIPAPHLSIRHSTRALSTPSFESRSHPPTQNFIWK